MDRDEFYIGYAERAPAGLARRTRVAVGIALAVGGVVALAVATLQGPFAPKTFEYGHDREFIGWLRLEPVPRLVVAAPRGAADAPTLLSYPLTRAGTKWGARELVAGFGGGFVKLRGWLIYRETTTLIDVVPGSLQRLAAGGAGEPVESIEELGVHTLTGQIVDSKCYFGVMNPGSGKVHRACAVRCISSGTPPVLAIRDAAGRERALLLVGRDGRAIHREILSAVAEPVEITGPVSRVGRLLVLRAEPAAIRRLGRLARR